MCSRERRHCFRKDGDDVTAVTPDPSIVGALATVRYVSVSVILSVFVKLIAPQS